METMLKKEITLIERFKKLEAEIIDILKQNDVDFDENLNGKEVKAKLKKYIANVKKMEKLFEEYEALAEKIEKISGDENDKGVMNEAVVNLREDKEQTEVVVDKATNTVIVKRKKKSNVSQREM
ncbi:MAG: hypothetical protein IJ310_05490 [Clostridia bacterium]|nr:hypothetical protein [Clostridiales bacterium]MBQ7918238.1 hypothetical protein [Clostridia bacterium]